MIDAKVKSGIIIPSDAIIKAGLTITHQFFADDLLMVVRANMATVLCLKRTLVHFEKLSGLAVNKDISELYFTSSVRRRSVVVRALGCKVGSLPFNYLGLPISGKMLRRQDCTSLIDKVIVTTTRWNGMHLSMAGKVELSRTVILPVVLYWTSVYSLPAVVINLIEKRMRNFI
ncbi:uncharacterized protein LOC132301748 [Cornus florida]|uniref:uncharacterized protein LOC132301748 n=1 Tax=Cornus florida TaxID=4283 RepID=UPI0028A0197D|nr:uncharacterized protein LOC132301748 [Cornus florida]